jgi:two-component system OmpR family sensor kinase
VSLRARLLAGVLLLATLGLLASDAATLTFLRRYLVHRLDQQLLSARFPVSRRLFRDNQFAGLGGFPGGTGFPGASITGARTATTTEPTSIPASGSIRASTPASIPSSTPVSSIPAATTPRTGGLVPNDYFMVILDPKGTQLAAFPATYRSEAEPAPQLPPIPLTEALRRAGKPFEVGAVGDAGFRYRAVAQVVASGRATVVLASPLSDLNATEHQVFVVESFVTLAVLAGLALLALWVVRTGLRPLDAMAATADAIAEGDLSRRVEHEDHKTEVGRLGAALNAMLGQIEAAFSERAASENRLRRFVADASHELRTPLTSIRGYAELFRRGAATRPEDLEKAMRRIEEEATRMGVLVDDLLLLARLDQGRPLDRRPVDLAKVARDAVDDAVAVEPDRPIDFRADGAPVVPGDEGRLRQVAANLLANARVHTPAGTPVHVRVRVADGSAVLEVGDEGPGLTEEAAGRVFERFYRTDPSRARSHGGVGLGLSIVAAIAEAHGGRSTVSSTPGAGAVFAVYLPLVAPATGDVSAAHHESGPATDNGAEHGAGNQAGSTPAGQAGSTPGDPPADLTPGSQPTHR